VIEILRSRPLKNTIAVICIFFLMTIILFAPLQMFVYDLNTYKELYEKNNVYEAIDETDAEKLTISIIDYLKKGKEIKSFELKNNLPFFTENEISHLNDVRILIRNILYMFYTSITLFIIFLFLLSDKNKTKYLKRISIILISSSSVIIILILFLYFFSSDFIPLFERFHYIFFPQGNWAFPENSLLITLLPLNFFYEFFIKLLISSSIMAFILLLIGVIVYVLSSRKKYIM